ncbi:MAG: HNH endonuclease [Chloroflexi bacterium]|nr:HNH endonuclease [Chloroflexota bacterium]
MAVLRRDEWRCRACGCETPQALRGTCDPSAPEVDHIVPVAKGGAHTMDNLQCLCRTCNALKSDMLMDEFIAWASGCGVTPSEKSTAFLL